MSSDSPCPCPCPDDFEFDIPILAQMDRISLEIKCLDLLQHISKLEESQAREINSFNMDILQLKKELAEKETSERQLLRKIGLLEHQIRNNLKGSNEMNCLKIQIFQLKMKIFELSSENSAKEGQLLKQIEALKVQLGNCVSGSENKVPKSAGGLGVEQVKSGNIVRIEIKIEARHEHDEYEGPSRGLAMDIVDNYPQGMSTHDEEIKGKLQGLQLDVDASVKFPIPPGNPAKYRCQKCGRFFKTLAPKMKHEADCQCTSPSRKGARRRSKK